MVQCRNCHKELDENITGLHEIKNGYNCDDCYYEAWGRAIDQYPLVSGSMGISSIQDGIKNTTANFVQCEVFCKIIKPYDPFNDREAVYNVAIKCHKSNGELGYEYAKYPERMVKLQPNAFVKKSKKDKIDNDTLTDISGGVIICGVINVFESTAVIALPLPALKDKIILVVPKETIKII